MNPNAANTDNNIFVIALSGALIFIASLWFTLSNLPFITTMRAAYILVPALLYAASAALLARAIKMDRERLRKI